MPTGSADSPAARALAIANALEALLAARHDDATARFDAELTAAVAAGRLDDETARTLRWWQRASVRGAQDYLAALLPGVLHADDAAQRKSRAHHDLAAASWQQATEVVRAAAPIAPQRAEPDQAGESGQASRAGESGESGQAGQASQAEPESEPAEGRMRVRLVAMPRPADDAESQISTVPPDGKDAPGHDHSATTA